MDSHQFWGMATPKLAKVLQEQMGKTQIPKEQQEQGWLLFMRKTTQSLE